MFARNVAIISILVFLAAATAPGGSPRVLSKTLNCSITGHTCFPRAGG